MLTEIGNAAVALMGLEKRAVQGQGFTAKTYEQLVLSGADLMTMHVDAKTALKCSAVWQAVKLISGDLAKLPLEKLRVQVEPNGKQREMSDRGHPTWRVVHDRPTTGFGAFKWWRRFYVQLLLWSNAYARINRDGTGNVVSLTLLESSQVQNWFDEDGEGGYWYLAPGGIWDFLRVDEMIHVEDMALHRTSSMGRSRETPLQLIEQFKEYVRLCNALEKFGSRFFEQGGRRGGWLELPAQMTQRARDNVEKGFREVYESLDGAFKTIIARGGVKFHEGQTDPDKTQMVESREFGVLEAARWFNLPPHKLGDDSRISYNSLEQENKSYLDSTLSPHLTAVADECKCKLLRASERDNGLHLYRHDVSRLISVDTQTLYDIGSKGVPIGLITKNEWRERAGLNPVDGGDEFMTPLNMQVGESEGTEGDSEGGEGETNVNEDIRNQLESYGVGVRAGAITPQQSDEQAFRALAGLPPIEVPVGELWKSQGGVRRPVTLKGGDESEGDPAEIDPDEPDPEPDEPNPEPEEDSLRFVRLPLLDSLQGALVYMERTCRNKAKQFTGDGFVRWLEAKGLEEATRRHVEDKMRTSVIAYAGTAGIGENELFERLFRALCSETRSIMSKNGKPGETTPLLLLERIENVHA